MEKPIFSPAFTVEDIGKLREWNYERQKHMTEEERNADNARRAASGRARLEEARRRLRTDVEKSKE